MKVKALILGMGLLGSLSAFAAGELRYGVEAEYPPFESRTARGSLRASISTSATPSVKPPSSSAAGWRVHSMR